ncbi:hypothetical protein C8Q74DRAFT_583597 [Fomes fomentarius]|nr:hypothetical protein C8Q74DRAFT_583597 [Fomes fomentarius]
MVDTNLDNTLGAALIGTILAACLFGLTTQQTVTYYRRSGEDHVILKVVIGLLWAFDAIHVALLSTMAYRSAVKHFGDADALARVPSDVMVMLIIAGIGDFIGRSLYTHKIWALSNGNRIVCGLLVTMTLGILGSEFAIAVKGFQCATWTELNEKLRWNIYVGLGLISISDITISATLCVFLRAGLRQSHSSTLIRTIRVLQVYTINAGITTSLCSLVTLILYAIAPNTMLYLITFYMLPKLFLNALLAMLNARKSLRSRLGTVVSVHMVTTATDIDPCSEHGDLEGGRRVGDSWSERIVIPKGP